MSVFTANKLKEARTKAGFSQEEVAKRMHMSRRNLQYLESNERPVTAEDIVEFAKLYKVDVRAASKRVCRGRRGTGLLQSLLLPCEAVQSTQG